ncbi:MAG: addiction module protein [Opitutales bacterium]
MTVQERLTAMEQIWDSLCHEESEPESPSWHGEVLAERKNMMDSPEAKYLTINQLRERYR